METALFGRYKLHKILGEGVYATVFLATDEKNRKYALKCFNKKSVRQNHLSQEMEAFHLFQLHPHPNIVTCYEILEDENYLFLVQEYLAQGDLLRCLTLQGTLSEEEARRIFLGIMRGVQHLHSIGLVHRDIKLENIALDATGSPKIIDFNLSSRWQQGQTLARYCGSVGYCAPEIIQRRPYVGPELDVWSIGVVLYLLVYGVFPFTPDPADVTDDQKKRRVREKTVLGKFHFPQTEKKPELEDLISGMLRVDPQTRLHIDNVLRHSWVLGKREKEEKENGKKKWELAFWRFF